MGKDYQSHTKVFYQNKEKASQYRIEMHEERGWGAFSTRRYLQIAGEYLSKEIIHDGDRIIDIPCGTGVAGPLLSSYPVNIVPMDISREMMTHALDQYKSDKLLGFVRADITKIPLAKSSVQGAVVLGLMHRVPKEVKIAALSELKRTCKEFVIISFSIESVVQKLKRYLLNTLLKDYGQASDPLTLPETEQLLKDAGFSIKNAKYVAYFASSEIVFHLKVC